MNGNPIMARSCHRGRKLKGKNDIYTYKVDDGSTIEHKYSDGAIKLAIKLLKTIKE